IEDGKVDLSDIEAYIDLIEQLDNPTLVMFLRTNLEQIVNNQ
ncbi:MAG: Rgg/GadR/MutR family transcriptional regulator, partial [Lactobacillus iners]|nr:Rgg/GadR/MutR family transcriptional regulator [Lactobacillus iners]MCT7782868.1 Rgg/GadR/MutR family transcriptional regulator [Lactobacillus iners]